MNCFILLSAEIRHEIWLDCLPVRPTTHFFEVVNYSRKRHMTDPRLVGNWTSDIRRQTAAAIQLRTSEIVG